jgi:hypothetical protein
MSDFAATYRGGSPFPRLSTALAPRCVFRPCDGASVDSKPRPLHRCSPATVPDGTSRRCYAFRTRVNPYVCSRFQGHGTFRHSPSQTEHPRGAAREDEDPTADEEPDEGRDSGDRAVSRIPLRGMRTYDRRALTPPDRCHVPHCPLGISLRASENLDYAESRGGAHRGSPQPAHQPRFLCGLRDNDRWVIPPPCPSSAGDGQRPGKREYESTALWRGQSRSFADLG